MFKIDKIIARCEEKQILNGISLQINPGEIHAIMGPNGSGNSTLSKLIAGHSDYEVESGDISFLGNSIIDLEPEERAYLNIFVGFQYPLEVSGVSNMKFLHTAKNNVLKANGKPLLTDEAFDLLLKQEMERMDIGEEFKSVTFSSAYSQIIETASSKVFSDTLLSSFKCTPPALISKCV